MNPKILTDLIKVEMPFGKYKGVKICDARILSGVV